MVDGEHFFPHITLYSVVIPNKNIGTAIKMVSQVAAQTNKLGLVAESPQKGYEGFIIQLITPSPTLSHLHQSIVTALNPLREGLMAQSFVSQKHLSAQAKINIKKYGHANTMESFEAHLTVIRYQKEHAALTALSNLDIPISPVSFDHISIYKWGKHQSELIDKFNLQ